MTYDPDWDPYLYEIRRMPEVEIEVGPDKVKAHTINGINFYVLKEDWTPEMAWMVEQQNPNAQYLQLERNDSVN